MCLSRKVKFGEKLFERKLLSRLSHKVCRLLSSPFLLRKFTIVFVNLRNRAQLFEGRLALNPGLNFTWVSFSFVQKHFLGQFSLIFIEHRIINLLTKRIKLNLLYKLSYLNSNFALTLGYLNPALNNPAQDGRAKKTANLVRQGWQ